MYLLGCYIHKYYAGSLVTDMLQIVILIFTLQGEEITIHYSGGLKGRLVRQRLTNEGWFFSCRCNRCLSGTELGSHFSSLICSICANEKGNCQFIQIIYTNCFNDTKIISITTVRNVQKMSLGNEVKDDDIAIIPLIPSDIDDAQNYGEEDYICCSCNRKFPGIFHYTL